MQFPSEVIQWCSMYCTGAPATHKVDFSMDGEEYSVKVCDECLEEFLDNGLPEGKND